jgi:endonuclease YncB( thermonuclease family)
MKWILFACLTILLAAPAAPAAAKEAKSFTGSGLALNGDTLLVNKDGRPTQVRLWAIKAPDLRNWPWGPMARAALDDLLTTSGPLVTCQPRGTREGPIVATCSIAAKRGSKGGGDLGGYLISLGLAVENRTYTSPGPGSLRLFYVNPYEPWETNARIRRLGVWSDPAWSGFRLDSKPPVVPKLGSKPGKIGKPGKK